jgi:general secretion pathway protein G
MCATTSPKHQRGWTVVELMIALVALAVLTTIAVTSYSKYQTRARNAKAANDLVAIQTAVSQYFLENQSYPAALSNVSASVAAMTDPWGNAYQFINHQNTPSGQWRKDKNIHPINTDYDLYSKGADGQSASPLTSGIARDDIVRANNGRFMGLASTYDP